MNNKFDIPTELYEDEVVCYFADRYHTTPQKVIQCFLVQDNLIPTVGNEVPTFRLEDNEMEIMRGLTTAVFHNKGIN